jgi:hypothetical protein
LLEEARMSRSTSLLLRLFASLVGPILVLLTVRQACAEERGSGTGNGDGPGNGRGRSEAPAPLEPRAIAAWDHFEVSMGFLAGQRRYHSTPFAYKSGETTAIVLVQRERDFGLTRYRETV